MFGKKNQYTLTVEGMHCAHCAKRLQDALKALKGVRSCKADPATGRVELVGEAPDPAVLTEAVAAVGFRLTGVEKTENV